MKFLLDIPALLAWKHQRHVHHAAFHRWIVTTGMKNVTTCAHVELGFIRVSMQVFKVSLADAATDLKEIRKVTGAFIGEAPSPLLPAWVDRPEKTSDGYLTQVAATAGLRLATFDTGIPGAMLIAP